MQRRVSSRTTALHFFSLDARLGWVVKATSRPLYPWHRDLTVIAQEICWASKPSEWAHKISPPLEFERRTVQAVWILYTDCSVKVMYLYFHPEKLHSYVISAEDSIRYRIISQNISYPKSIKYINTCNKYK